MKHNCQEMFLNAVRKQKLSVTVYLNSGIKLNGKIIGFDNFSMMLKRDSQIQLIYKHSVSTIVPAEGFDINELLSQTQNISTSE